MWFRVRPRPVHQPAATSTWTCAWAAVCSLRPTALPAPLHRRSIRTTTAPRDRARMPAPRDNRPMSLNHPAGPRPIVALTALASATDRLLSTIDQMPARAFTEPSLLPGWSRAHVLAHLALNSKALAAVLTTIGQESPLPMYASDAGRDLDIARMATQSASHIADRVAVGAAMLAGHLGGGPSPDHALESVGAAGHTTESGLGLRGSARIATSVSPAHDDVPAATGSAPHTRSSATHLGPNSESPAARDQASNTVHGGPSSSDDRALNAGVFARAAAESSAALEDLSKPGTFERTPGGRVMDAAQIPLMRWREVEIHHADLNLGYGPDDWHPEFTEYLLALAAWDRDPEFDVTLRIEAYDVVPGETDAYREATARSNDRRVSGARIASRAPNVREAGSAAAATSSIAELVLGRGGTVISGSSAEVAWWLIGRGRGEGLASDALLPELGPWVRR